MEEQTVATKTNWTKELYELLDSIIISVVCVLAVFTLIFRIFVVSGPSMEPTLENGERLIVSGMIYKPAYGDIVCFYSDYRNEVLVKRVIALPGQTVDISEDNRVYVDGKELREDYIGDLDTLKKTMKMPFTVTAGHVFVLGDNRGNSMDSRYVEIGEVSRNDIIGKLVFRLFPRFGTVK